MIIRQLILKEKNFKSGHTTPFRLFSLKYLKILT